MGAQVRGPRTLWVQTFWDLEYWQGQLQALGLFGSKAQEISGKVICLSFFVSFIKTRGEDISTLEASWGTGQIRI